jgi:hypothetical protein
MRLVLVIFSFLWFSITTILGQQSQVLTIDKLIHDFEIVMERSGWQTTEFTVYNPTRKIYSFIESSSTCGCTALNISKETLYPGDSAHVLTLFDPKGKSGKTTQSITLTFVDNTNTIQPFHLNLYALVLNENDLHQLKIKTRQQEKNVAYFYQQTKQLDSFDNKSTTYQKYIEQAAKTALMDGKVRVLITIYSPSEKYNFGKILKEARKSIMRDLIEKGIPEGKIIFEDPTAELSSPNEYIQLSIIETIEDIEQDLQNSMVSTPLLTIQNLPIFQQNFYGGINSIDTSSIDFKLFINDIKERSTLANIHFLIVNSSSNAPVKGEVQKNKYVAELRGERAKTLLRHYFIDSLDANKFSFINITTGPQYNLRYYLPQFYYNFQYTKIIPYFKNDSIGLKTDYYTPYHYNFIKELDQPTIYESNFTDLMNRLSRIIQFNGYASIIIEASASHLPSAEYRDNEVLAYARISQFKKSINHALYLKGIPPSKLTVLEERSIVQGPPYHPQTDKKVYHPYQYLNVFIEK